MGFTRNSRGASAQVGDAGLILSLDVEEFCRKD